MARQLRQNPQKKGTKRKRGKTSSITIIQGAGRKKHVETMFNPRASKKYPFYYKKREILTRKITNVCVGSQYGLDRVCFYTQVGGYMKMQAFKSYARVLKQFFKSNKLKHVKSKIHVFPDFVLTAKPKEVRMGKGKGSIASRVALMRPGQQIATLSGLFSVKELAMKQKLIDLAC